MTDLAKITTPFGLLDKETQDALRAHGGPYEWYSCEGGKAVWVDDHDPDHTFAYCHHLTIRVKPQPPQPRDFWLYRDVGELWNVSTENVCLPWDEIIHVREVLE